MTQTLRTQQDERSLRSLLEELGRRCRAFRFEVAPNPCVGAAIVSDGKVVAEGFHRAWGAEHAEVEALTAAAAAGVAVGRDDLLAVTLEPCSSSGKQPPCTDAILASGIGRVVVGDVDPDPRHRGRGIDLLRERGVAVDLLPHASDLRDVAPHFVHWTHFDRLRRPRPWLVAKWAQTRTGQLTPPENVGEGRWISSPATLNEVQVLRGRVDAILTGIGTVLADDPRFTVRAPGEPSRAPARVVLDSDLRTPLGARLLEPAGEPGERGGPVTILCRPGASALRHRALTEAGARVHMIRGGGDGGLSLRGVLEWLWEQGARRVLVEAGPRLLEALLVARFVDQLRVYTGSINGGRGPSLASHLDPSHFLDGLHREVGDDAVLEAFLRAST